MKELSTHRILPHQGIHPVRLGMNKAEVRAAFPKPPQPFRKTPDSPHPTDAYEESGFHVYYNSDSETVEFVEAFPVKSSRFELFGLDLFGEKASVLAETLASLTTVVEQENGCTLTLPELDVSLWRSSPKDKTYKAVGVGPEGYYE